VVSNGNPSRLVPAFKGFGPSSRHWSEVKVRAQVTRNTYCTGGHIVDVEATYHDTSTISTSPSAKYRRYFAMGTDHKRLQPQSGVPFGIPEWPPKAASK